MATASKPTIDPEEVLMQNVLAHYNQWQEDNDTRRTRKNGWNDITDAYWGKLPNDWPYLSKVVDPRIRTTLIEKNARLLNAKLRGRLVPRDGGDVLSARLNNALLDYQWDSANHGGTMLEKWSIADMDTRLYGSKFALVLWRYEKDKDGNVLFCGNEYQPLDIRDSGMDGQASHIRDAKWFQARTWEKVEDLDKVSDIDGKPMYPGLGELKKKMKERNSDRRDNAFENRILSLKGLSDRVGEDSAFPVVEIVTEYRRDKWITFAPRYKVLLREIPNPYNHKKIPVVQLRYYSIQGDPLGESEVEPVIPIWRAIQATVCGFMDNMNLHIRPPLKIIDGQARIETIVYGPEAQWIVNSQDSVMELQGSNQPLNYFQTSYSALVAAFNTAMGDTSQGVSGIDPFNPEKTATEIRQSSKQQNTRDQKNQTSLAECIQDMMLMWMSNNKQFLFTGGKEEYILRIVGSELFSYFQRAGLDEMDVPIEAMDTIGQVIADQGGNVSDDDIQALLTSGQTPKYPIIENPKETNPQKLIIKPKMRINDMNDGAEISLVPKDVEGTFDYIADVRSMSTGADAELQQARQKAIELVITNPSVIQLLQAQQIQPEIQELLVDSLEDVGLKDAQRYFSKIKTLPGAIPGGGTPPTLPAGGLPPDLEATLAAGAPGAMAGPQGFPQQGGIPGGVQPGLQQVPGI